MLAWASLTCQSWIWSVKLNGLPPGSDDPKPPATSAAPPPIHPVVGSAELPGIHRSPSIDGNPLKDLKLFLDQGQHLSAIMKAGRFHKNRLH